MASKLKIWSFCSWAWLTSGSALADEAKPPPPPIVLPPTPRVIPPAYTTPEQVEDDYQRKRQQREDRDAKLRPPKMSPSEKRNEALKQEALKDRPLRFMMAINVVQPKALTSGDAKNYLSDLTTHALFLVRTGPELPDDELHFWYGLRLAPFSGSGIYKNVPGRFGFTYIGPMVGLGKIGLSAKSLGQNRAGQEEEEKQKESLVKDGFLLTAGLAMLNRTSQTSRGIEPKDGDFKSTGVVFDAPGLWAEATILRIYFGALSANFTVGAQMGKSKVFVYAGAGLGGWY